MMPKYSKGDVVRCVELSPENPEGLELYRDYVVMGFSYYGTDIVYAVKDCFDKLYYAIDLFVRQEVALEFPEEVKLDEITNPCGITIIPEEDDMVNHPSHYTDGGIETIDFIQAKLTQEQFEGYLIGNITKYMSRAGKKGEGLEDMKKAQWYLNKLVEVKSTPKPPTPMITKKQNGYICGLCEQLHMSHRAMPEWLSIIPDAHDLSEEQASYIIDTLLKIKAYMVDEM